VRSRRIGCVAVLGALLAFVLVTRGPEPPAPTPAGAFSFAVLGDAPYYSWEVPQFRLVLRAIDANDVAWVLHVGDIFWRPCTDDHYGWVLGQLNALHHPVVYTPGDNESFDCWQPGSGGFAPQDRWARIRQIFFDHPTRSLGAVTMPLTSQGGEFVENARWTRAGIVFATVDIVGSKNGMQPFPARTATDDAAAKRRTEAAAEWVRETLATAKNANASAVVIAFHGNPRFEDPVTNEYRRAYEPFIATLEEEVEQFQRPVLLVHGDGHEYIVDHPLARRPTDRRLVNLTRVQVPGSPRVGWVRVVVRPGAANPFAFEEHVVPRWKYW